MRKRKGRHARPATVLPPAVTRSTARLLPVALLGSAAAALTTVGVAADAATQAPAHPDLNESAQAAPHPVVFRVFHRLHRKMVTVKRGDTLSGISSSRCGAAGKWEHIYAANRRTVGANPNIIQPGQRLRAWCRDAIPATLLAAVSAPAHPTSAGSDSDESASQPAAQPQQPQVSGVSGVISTSGMDAFEACVIRAESGGNDQIWNASGHWGAFQFSASTWAAHGGNPADFGHAGFAEQQQVFFATVAADGTSDWAPYDGC